MNTRIQPKPTFKVRRVLEEGPSATHTLAEAGHLLHSDLATIRALILEGQLRATAGGQEVFCSDVAALIRQGWQ